MTVTIEKLTKIPRKFFPDDLDVSNWEKVRQEFEDLLNMPVDSPQELIRFIEKSSEMSKILRDERTQRQIRMTCFADKEEHREAYRRFFSDILTPAMPYGFKLNRKYYDSPFRNQLPIKQFRHYDMIISNEIEIYREENVPLFQKEEELSTEYDKIFSQLTVLFQGEEKTLQQLYVFLKDPDRTIREQAWRLSRERLLKEKENLDTLFDKLKAIRVQQAHNAGFDNYRDYRHKLLGRFSYAPEDLSQFHETVENTIVPLLKNIHEKRKQKLGLDSLKPWDMSVSLDGKKLQPFQKADELAEKGISVLSKIHPEFGNSLSRMKETGFLDLDNRKGKAPGGYNASLREYGASFIFMNAVGLQRDVSTFFHESGHALHSSATAAEPIIEYAIPPMEAAELASMSMELISMEYWNEFYSDEEDLKKARREQLEGTLSLLPWVMIIDSFQHWIYTQPDHTPEQRQAYFLSLMDRYNTGVEWADMNKEKGNEWLRQLHLFHAPFYYIEYAISQLGALSVYMNYKKDKTRAITDYETFLKAGYSQPLDKIYHLAGIPFDFSEDYIKKLAHFVKEELDKLE